ncbi:DMT family transporter [Geofilum rubicundum]|uniref:Permease n=1 Tax=Geofilum rubicundum JCM 15548 TaxID=1236989 RepID=A0A0E9M143_9BACT|nr:DMT family transporter [Geofilum rubicundum]GAO31273.1 permease [Geofilum rubicundum JCM 15548]
MLKFTKQHQAYMGLIVFTVIVGLSFLFVKIGLRYADPMDLLAHRFSAAAVAIVPLWIFGRVKFPPFNWRKVKWMLLLSLFYPLLFFALQTFGLQHSSASEAGIIFATTPIVTLLAAGFFLKEKTTWLQKLGISMTLAGILYIIFYAGGGAGETSLKGVILLLLSILSLVVYYVLGKVVSAHFSAMEITLWMTILAFLVFNAYSLVSHMQNQTLGLFFNSLVHMEFLWSVLYLGVLSSLLTAFLTNFALTQVPASQIAVFNNLSPLIAIAAGVFILEETLFTYHVVGGLLVLSGVALTVFFKAADPK